MKTHWKKLHNPNYFGPYVFDENRADIIDMIVSVSTEMVKNQDGKEESCVVAKLKYNKPIILNSTNSKTITKVSGSPFIEDWANTWVSFFVTNVNAFGTTTEAVRIRTRPPVFNEKHPAYADAVKAIKDGKRTKEQIKAAFPGNDAVIEKL